VADVSNSRSGAVGDTTLAPTDLDQVGRGGALNLVGVAVSALATFALTLVVTRSIEPSAAGVFFAGTSALLLVATLGRLGTNTSLVYFVAQARARGHESVARQLLSLATRPVLGLVVVLASLWVVVSPKLSAGAVGDSSSGTLMVQVLALALPAAVFHEVWLSLTRGFRRMGPTVVIERIGLPVAQLAAVAAVAAAGAGPTSLMIAWAAPFLPTAGLAWLIAHRTVRGALSAEPPSAEAAISGRTFWRFTLPRAASSLAQLGLARFDILLVAAIAGPAQAALYVAATRFVVVGQLAAQSLSQSVQPQVAESAAAGDTDAIQSLYQVTTTWLVLLTWPLYVTAAVFAPELMSLFGSSYPGATPVVLVMAVAMLLASASGMVDIFLIMAGRSSAAMVNALVALTSMVGLDLLLIPPWGATGAAVGWALAIAVRNFLALVVLYREQGLHPITRSSMLAMSMSAVAFGLVPLAAALAAGPAAGWRFIGLLIGLLLWLAAVARCRHVLTLDGLGRQLQGRLTRRQGSTAPTRGTRGR